MCVMVLFADFSSAREPSLKCVLRCTTALVMFGLICPTQFNMPVISWSSDKPLLSSLVWSVSVLAGGKTTNLMLLM